MRSQLLRRSSDLKKNISGSQKYLDVLREMSAVVSEAGRVRGDSEEHSNPSSRGGFDRWWMTGM